jgi:molybdopterin-biosynthesis enzyme MoeA-like protein
MLNGKPSKHIEGSFMKSSKEQESIRRTARLAYSAEVVNNSFLRARLFVRKECP